MSSDARTTLDTGSPDLQDVNQILVTGHLDCKTVPIVTYTAVVVRDVDTAGPRQPCSTDLAMKMNLWDREDRAINSQQDQAGAAARRWTRRAGIWTLFIGLTIAMTWPMALHLAARSVDHFDINFNLWRLRWIHHALTTSPTHLFDGNQFFPERRVLSYSDAILVQGLLATPLLAIGVSPLLVHNLVLLGGMCASGIGMYALARHLTKNEAAAVLAGVVFAFAPFRFGHIMHLEMQWAVWSPLAFWALQKTLESGRLKYGVLTGVFAALQLMSSIYYGLFLGVLLGVVGGLQWLFVPRERRVPSLQALAVGALVVMVCAAIYSRPYKAASDRVGVRSPGEVLDWSAGWSSYGAVSETNRVYASFPKGWDEHSLFPGFVPPLLALVGLALVRPRRTAIIYAVGLALAFDMSFGLNGIIYPWLYKYGGVFSGLRAPARASIFFLLFLGALAAHGAVAVLERLSRRVHPFAAAALVGLVLLEYWVAPLRLIRYPIQAPPLAQFLRQRPDGAIAHFPTSRHDTEYLYTSTFHWKPMVNGYSGYFPPSYGRRLRVLESFPDARSIGHLMGEGVRYLVIHESFYKASSEPAAILLALQKLNLAPAARLHDGYGMAVVYELQ